MDLLLITIFHGYSRGGLIQSLCCFVIYYPSSMDVFHLKLSRFYESYQVIRCIINNFTNMDKDRKSKFYVVLRECLFFTKSDFLFENTNIVYGSSFFFFLFFNFSKYLPFRSFSFFLLISV